ncbi:MAG: hypothetical protein J7M05_04840 [Anaerolineae bacterium]|nr:hypothetical protein [Anaerolineae bacterium]
MKDSPLQLLLERLAEGPVHTPTGLAQSLGVGPALLEQMLLDLERAGYLKTLKMSCGRACEGCPLRKSCGLFHQGRIWALTPKGFAAVEKGKRPAS